MELSTEQRKAISSNCLPASWQMTTARRLRHNGAATDTPEVLVDWLQNASPRSQALVLELVRHLADRPWRLALRPPAADAAPGLRSLDVVCGGLRWTLWLQARPQLCLVGISR